MHLEGNDEARAAIVIVPDPFALAITGIRVRLISNEFFRLVWTSGFPLALVLLVLGSGSGPVHI
jgi:hypothetical protein